MFEFLQSTVVFGQILELFEGTFWMRHLQTIMYMNFFDTYTIDSESGLPYVDIDDTEQTKKVIGM